MILLSFAGVTAQTSSAGGSAAIAPVQNGGSVTQECADKLATAEARLLKTLDALEKSETLLSFKDREIAARINLENLYKQAIEVKDLIIKYQDELIKKLQRPNKGFLARLKQILAIAEKAALIALGIGVGRGF